MKVVALLLLSGLAAVSAKCPNDCSGHGSCNVYSACECYRNWMGADCSERMCYFGLAFVDTPAGDLNTDGFISTTEYNTRTSNVGVSEIYPWYAGWGSRAYSLDDSDTASVVAVTQGGSRGEAHFYKECSNKGICNRGTGICECFPGYSGEGCSRTACPNDCSGHGTCARLVDSHPTDEGNESVQGYFGWDAYATQECKCDPGYFGPNCSLRKCPKGDDPVTKYQGFTRVTFKDKHTYPTNFYDGTCIDMSLPEASTLTEADMAVVDGNSCSDVLVGSGAHCATADKRVWVHGAVGTCSTSTANDCYPDTSDTGNSGFSWNPWYSRGGNSPTSDYLSGSTATTITSKQLCHYASDSGFVGTEVCMRNPVRWLDDAARKESAIYTHKMVATGSDSKATGTLTGGGCGGPNDLGPYNPTSGNYPNTFECAQLDFWSMYLKDVSGEFQVGDKINVTGYATVGVCSDVNLDAGTKANCLLSTAPAFGMSGGTAATAPDAATTFHRFASQYVSDSTAFSYDLCNYIKEIGTYYATDTALAANGQNDGQQEDEVQVITIKFSPIPRSAAGAGVEHTFGGHFAIEFTDEMGDTWMTRSIPITSHTESDQTTGITESDTVHYDIYPVDTSFTGTGGSNSAFTSLTGGDPTSHISRAIEAALEELPNGVVGDVEVTFIQDTSAPEASGATWGVGRMFTERSYAIRFMENSGNLPRLSVAYSLTNDTSDMIDITATAGYDTPLDGAIEGYTNAVCGSSSASCVSMYSGSSHTAFNSNMNQTFIKKATSDTPPSAGVFVQDTSFKPFPAYNMGVAKGNDGNKENIECSNRGICDYATGLCKCFNGFTNEDCSLQNALSMGA